MTKDYTISNNNTNRYEGGFLNLTEKEAEAISIYFYDLEPEYTLIPTFFDQRAREAALGGFIFGHTNG